MKATLTALSLQLLYTAACLNHLLIGMCERDTCA